ncbi:hypothetical protein NLM27_20825 [Bradyrhizobium sp. CCGB12]|uniref:hypothetical protein n=1 Tax=Bradyrhizobium sp. CCGB12 TaxID=2949632 RepID=UPI0020B195D0|nr:hypothetical protein [Bradyrhizobium sp. CCGB12]MCP3391233.1 hypothetical protein [Bradyrhizobium sp. CCGB12]
MDHSTALTTLVEGNIFQASFPNGASCICLVNSIADDEIRATRITTQEKFVFDRATGAAVIGDGLAVCTINSIAPLPAEIHETLLQLDRRYGSGDYPTLRREEIDALLFVEGFYPAHPL